MKSLELKIPPPVVFIMCSVLAWGISKFIPSLTLQPTTLSISIALAITVAGVAIAATGVLHFYRAGTTIHPHNPQETSTIVDTGVYAKTRNPMYLGLLLVLIAVVVYFGNPLGIVSLVAFLAYINRFQTLPEERILASKFGDSYHAYLNQVRRWL